MGWSKDSEGSTEGKGRPNIYENAAVVKVKYLLKDE
jgi:hypothetical protein